MAEAFLVSEAIGFFLFYLRLISMSLSCLSCAVVAALCASFFSSFFPDISNVNTHWFCTSLCVWAPQIKLWVLFS